MTDSVTFVFDTNGRVTALRLDWLFDDFFSAQLLQDFDADGNGSFDEAAPVTLDGAPPACRHTVAEDRDHAYYFDMVYPQMIRLDCGTS